MIIAVRTCAPFRKGSGAPEHRPTPRHMVRSRIRQVRTGNRKPFLKGFRFRFQVQVQEMDHPVLICNNGYKNRRSHTAVILALVRWNGTDSGKRCTRCKQNVQKGFRCTKKVQTGARSVRRGAKRCKKVQVQVQIRLKRFRCTGAPAGSANSHEAYHAMP